MFVVNDELSGCVAERLLEQARVHRGGPGAVVGVVGVVSEVDVVDVGSCAWATTAPTMSDGAPTANAATSAETPRQGGESRLGSRGERRLGSRAGYRSIGPSDGETLYSANDFTRNCVRSIGTRTPNM